MAKQEILTAEQKKVITLVSHEPKLSTFYLSGGTALSAFYLQHRLSDDLDFFCEKTIDRLFLHEFMEKVKKELKGKKIRYEKLFDRNIFFVEFGKKKKLKMEFTKYPFKHIGKLKNQLDIPVDSLKDLAANKLMALLDRFDPKDFVDIYFLLQHFTIKQIRKDAEKKFGVKIGDMLLGSELAKVARVEALPKMYKRLTVKQLKDFFSELAKEVGDTLVQ